jgi:UDP-2-acetamido-3-amino-2,3-dideoxy-glucuronate N-acetyltransferase
LNLQPTPPIYTGVTCEDDVIPTEVEESQLSLTDLIPVNRRGQDAKAIVHKGASISANAAIACGHDIGKYAFIGTGVLVTKTIPDYALVEGNLARQTGWMSGYGYKLHFDKKGVVEYPESGQLYCLKNEMVQMVK